MGADRALLRRVPALRVHLGICLLTAIATAAAVVAQAQVLSNGLSQMTAGDLGAIRPLVIALVTIGAIRGAARWATDRSATAAVIATRRALTGGIIRKLDRLDATARETTHPATVTSMATTGVDAIEPWIRSYLPAVCLAAVVPLAAGIRILFADLLSAVILLVAIPLIPVFMILIGRLTDERSQRQWATLQRLGSHFHDVLLGLETLRLFGRAEAQIDRVRKVTDDYRRAVLRTLRVAFLSALVLELLATLSVALVAVAAGVRLADGRISLATALIVLLLAPECSLPLRRVGAAFHAAVAGSDASADLDDFDQLSDTPDGPEPRPAAGTLHVVGLVVDDPARGRRAGPIDLKVAPGEIVALRGPTGSGKSTVLASIMGETPITAGCIQLGEAPITELSRTARRASIVTVPQHPAPLCSSVAASVMLGSPDASPAVGAAVLESVDLDDLATRRPDELSGGELQRLAIARALLAIETRGVGLLLADEPTAHLDRERASLVIEGLRGAATAGAAVLVVTHDVAVMERADRVVSLSALADDPGDNTDRPDRQWAASVDARHARARLMPEPVAGDATTRALDAPVSGNIGDLAWFRQLAPVPRGRIAGARALGIAAEACTIGLAATAAWLIFRAAEHPSFADLAVVAVAVRAFGLGKGVLRYAERLASHDATLRQLGEIRAAVVGQLGRLVPTGLPRTGRGELLAAVVDDVERLGDLELRVVGPAISSATVAVAAAVGVAMVAGRPALVLAGGVAVAAAVVPWWVGRRGMRTASALVSAKADVATTLLEFAERSGEVAALDATSNWSTTISSATDRVVDIERSRGRTSATASGIIAALGPWTAAATVAVIGTTSTALSGPATGVAVLLPLAVLELLMPAVAGAELVSTVAASAARLRALLSRPDPTPEPDEPVPLGPNANVLLGDVTLRWPGGPSVLSGLDLDLPEGSRLAVRGPSGSGKSTLAAGLVAFLTPASGTYALGGVDTRALGGAETRTKVTWCGQEPWLADTSIRENLRIASPDAGDDELWVALSTMRLTEWVRSLPDELDTLLGRDGATASGGQRHRLALARVLLANHRVIILDEPTAHLDRDTGTAVLNELLDALEGRSIVLIGHADIAIRFDLTIDTTPSREPVDTP